MKNSNNPQTSFFLNRPSEVKYIVSYQQGVTLSRATEISNTLTVGASLEASLGIGPFSASASASISNELGSVSSASSREKLV